MLGHVCPNPGRMGVKLVGPVEGGEDVRDRVTDIMVEHCSNGNDIGGGDKVGISVCLRPHFCVGLMGVVIWGGGRCLGWEIGVGDVLGIWVKGTMANLVVGWIGYANWKFRKV